MTDERLPDRETLAEIDAEIERLVEAAERLRELGHEAGMPAIERNAKRVRDSATALEDNLPPEIVEE